MTKVIYNNRTGCFKIIENKRERKEVRWNCIKGNCIQDPDGKYEFEDQCKSLCINKPSCYIFKDNIFNTKYNEPQINKGENLYQTYPNFNWCNIKKPADSTCCGGFITKGIEVKATNFNYKGSFGAQNFQNIDACGPIWNEGGCGYCYLLATVQAVLANGVINSWGNNDKGLSPQTTDIPYIMNSILDNDKLSHLIEKGQSCVCNGGSSAQVTGAILCKGIKPAIDNNNWLYKFSNAGNLIDLDCCTENSNLCLKSAPTSTSENTFIMNKGQDCNFNNGYGVYEIETEDNNVVASYIMTHGPLLVVVNGYILEGANSPWFEGNWQKWQTKLKTKASYFIPQNTLGNITSSTASSHQILLVGWITYQNKPYWIIRNEWTTTFGNNGYAFVEFGDNKSSKGFPVSGNFTFGQIQYLNNINLQNYNSPAKGSTPGEPT